MKDFIYFLFFIQIFVFISCEENKKILNTRNQSNLISSIIGAYDIIYSNSSDLMIIYFTDSLGHRCISIGNISKEYSESRKHSVFVCTDSLATKIMGMFYNNVVASCSYTDTLCCNIRYSSKDKDDSYIQIYAAPIDMHVMHNGQTNRMDSILAIVRASKPIIDEMESTSSEWAVASDIIAHSLNIGNRIVVDANYIQQEDSARINKFLECSKRQWTVFEKFTNQK